MVTTLQYYMRMDVNDDQILGINTYYLPLSSKDLEIDSILVDSYVLIRMMYPSTEYIHHIAHTCIILPPYWNIYDLKVSHNESLDILSCRMEVALSMLNNPRTSMLFIVHTWCVEAPHFAIMSSFDLFQTKLF